MPAKWVVLDKSNQEIRKEIPNSGGTNGKYFGKIEVPLKLAHQNPNNKAVNGQSNHRNGEELPILFEQVWVLAVESINSVEDVVCGGGGRKANGICKVLVNFGFLLQKIGYAKIDKNTRCANETKLNEFGK